MTALSPALITSDVLVSDAQPVEEPALLTFYKAHSVAILCAVGALIAFKVLM